MVGCVLLDACLALAGGSRADERRTADPPLLVVVRDGKYGYIDRAGSIVVPPRFAYAEDFLDGMARVKIDKQYSYINPAGELLGVRFDPPCRFQDRQYAFAEGLAVFRVGGKDKRTPRRLPSGGGRRPVRVHRSVGGEGHRRPVRRCRRLFGRARRREKRNALGLHRQARTRRSSRLASTPPKEFHGGLARVAVAGKWGFIDKQGATVVPPRVEEIPTTSTRTGPWSVWTRNTGTLIARGSWLSRRSSSTPRRFLRPGHGAGRSWPGRQFGYPDKAGQFAIPPEFGEARDFSDGLAPVKVARPYASEDKPEGLWGYIDPSGAYVIRPRFSYAGQFSEGWRQQPSPGRAPWLYQQARRVPRSRRNSTTGRAHSGGIARVYSDRDYATRDEHGYIDKSGHFLWKVRALEARNSP